MLAVVKICPDIFYTIYILYVYRSREVKLKEVKLKGFKLKPFYYYN